MAGGNLLALPLHEHSPQFLLSVTQFLGASHHVAINGSLTSCGAVITKHSAFHLPSVSVLHTIVFKKIDPIKQGRIGNTVFESLIPKIAADEWQKLTYKS